MKAASKKRLTPYLSVFGAFGIALGCCIGSACFLMPGSTFLPTAGPVGTMISMLIGAMVMLLFSVNFHLLINRFPEAGGTYSYAKHAFGADHGFLCAWLLLQTYAALIWANATSIPLIIRYLIGDVFRFGYMYTFAGYEVYFGEALLSICVIVFTAALCIMRKKGAALVQAVLTIVFLFGIVIAFATAAHHSNTGTILPAFAGQGSLPGQILRILAIAPWTFVGFESISHSSEEFLFSRKKAGLIMASAIILSAVAYILMTMQATFGIPAGYADWTSYVASLDIQSGFWSVPTIAAAVQGFGHLGFILIGITILAAMFTTMLAGMIAVSRLLYSMSRDGIFPKPLSVLNYDNIPENAIIFVTLLSSIIPFLGRTIAEWHVEISNLGAAIAYGYTSAAVLKYAEKRWERIVGIAGIVLTVILTVLLIFPNYMRGSVLSQESYLIFSGWCIVGFLLFRRLLKKHDEFQVSKSMIVWLVMLGLIFCMTILWDRKSSLTLNTVTLDSVSDFYHQQLDKHGIDLTPADLESEKQFMQEKLRHADNVQINDSLVQAGLLAVTILTLFSIFSMMRKRERQIEYEKNLASMQSRAKSVFLSNMSHDIRTPMNAIIGFTNLALRDVDSPEKMKDYLTKIQASSEHLLSLISDLLEMSRIESGKIELYERPCSLPDVLHSLNTLIISQVETKQLELSMNVMDVVDEQVCCDNLRLRQILLNLLSYAINNTPSGGRITLRLIQHESKQDGIGLYEFIVKDSGPGMSPVFAERVFDSFEWDQSTGIKGIQGSGLGMAMTKRLVELMGGTIQLTTAPGEGSEFSVRFEFRRDEETEKIDCVIPSLEGVRALIVDEDEDVCIGIAKMLARIGLRAEYTQSGKDAVSMANEAKNTTDPFGLFLLEWRMSDINSLETAQHIREASGSVPIVLCTAHDRSTVLEEASSVGINTVCDKPLFLSELHETLLHLFEGKAPERKNAAVLPSYEGKHVLIVEDIEINRDVIAMLLDDYHITVDFAVNGLEGVERIKNSKPGDYDLVFMDIQMPVMNGYEATRQIRALDNKALASIPIVAMTANAFEEDRKMSMDSGMNAHIAKPVEVKILEETLKEYLG